MHFQKGGGGAIQSEGMKFFSAGALGQRRGVFSKKGEVPRGRSKF